MGAIQELRAVRPILTHRPFVKCVKQFRNVHAGRLTQSPVSSGDHLIGTNLVISGVLQPLGTGPGSPGGQTESKGESGGREARGTGLQMAAQLVETLLPSHPGPRPCLCSLLGVDKTRVIGRCAKEYRWLKARLL